MELYGINDLHISGRLTRDPEFKFAQNGNEYANISIAKSLYSKSNPNQTLFIDCYVYGNYLINAIKNNPNYRRGAGVLVSGNIQGYKNRTNKTTNEELVTLKLNILTINQIEFPSISSDGPPQQKFNNQNNNSSNMDESLQEEYVPEEDIPF